MTRHENGAVTPDANPRVAVVLTQLGYGGAERQTVELLRSLKGTPWEPVLVISLSGETKPYGETLTSLGYRLHVVPRKNSIDVLRLLALRSILKHERIELVHAVHMLASAYAWLACRRTGINVLPSFRGARISNGWARRTIYARMMASSSHVLVNSFRGADVLGREFRMSADRVRVIPNGIDLDVLTAGQTVSLRRILNLADEPLVAFVGKPSPDKNVARFVDVTRHLIAGNPALHVAIIGHGLDEGARGAIAPGLSPGRVHFMGPRPDVPKLLAEVDVLVVTSTSEGCPNVVLEALAAGTCVVSSDVGDVARMLEGTSGEVVDRDETALFVAAIQRLIARGRPRSTAASVRRIRSQYGLERMVHRTVSLWAEMLNHRHPAPGPLLDDPDVPGSLQTAP